MENVIQSHIRSERVENDEKYIIYFLYEDEDQSVNVEEVDKIDFLRVLQHLNSSGSIFISKR